MSDVMMDDALVGEFLTECEEHLNGIENDLLELESSSANSVQEPDKELVNRIFRAAHSIKGGAGFFGFVRIRELAHRTEGVLDRVRNGELRPDAAMVSALLEAFDQLRTMLGNYRSSESTNLDSILNLLEAVSHPAGSTAGQDERELIEIMWPGVSTLFSIERGELQNAIAGGKTLYWVEFDLIRDIQRHALTPIEMLKRLGTYGRVLDTHLDTFSVGDLFEDDAKMRLLWHVLFATPLGSDMIDNLLDMPGEFIHIIDAKSLLAVEEHPHHAALAPRHLPVLAPPPAAFPASHPEPIEQAEPTPQKATQAKATQAKAAQAKAAQAKPPQAKPAPANSAPADAAPEPSRDAAEATRPDSSKSEATKVLRIPTTVIDSLMDLAGELVLSRNQLLSAVEKKDFRAIQQGSQKLNVITGDLQEIVMLTRMQPVGTQLQKFPRVVRDLAKTLGKEIELVLNGQETEIDKEILEGLSDPLTHMLRNAIDHGIESPEQRRKAGKPPKGRVELNAYHQSGQVVIDLIDDGKGIDGDKVAASAIRKGLISEERVRAMRDSEKQALIFLPGLSTADKVTDVSGRGVGMDVVKTNIDRLGGEVLILSRLGEGTTFRLKLPLTLVILPCLMMRAAAQRFAVPQSMIGEVLRIPAAQIESRIRRVGNDEVLVLRERLLPVLRLAEFLGAVPPDTSSQRAMHLLVLETAGVSYALVVDGFDSSNDIVVKPLSHRLEALREYMGAAILGDGKVTLVLDPVGLAERSGIKSISGDAAQALEEADAVSGELVEFLFFDHESEHCAVPLHRVLRVDMANPDELETVCGRRTLNRRGRNLPVVSLDETSQLSPFAANRRMVVIVFEYEGEELGLLGYPPFDTVSLAITLDERTHRRPGIPGSMLHREKTTLLVDFDEVGRLWLGDTVIPAKAPTQSADRLVAQSGGQKPLILLAEDSDFFRNQLVRLIEAAGYRVAAAPDGKAALDLLSKNPDVSLVATDVEMPVMDGLTFTREIRRHPKHKSLPIIALTSLAGEDDVARGLEAGVDEYQIKLDNLELLSAMDRLLAGVKR